MPETTSKTKKLRADIINAWMRNDKNELFKLLNNRRKELSITTIGLSKYGLRIDMIKNPRIIIKRKTLDLYLALLIDGTAEQLNDNADMLQYVRETSGFEFDFEYILETGISYRKLAMKTEKHTYNIPELNDSQFITKIEAEWPDVTPINEAIIKNCIDLDKLCDCIKGFLSDHNIRTEIRPTEMLYDYLLQRRRIPSKLYDYIINHALPYCKLDKHHIVCDYPETRRMLVTALLSANTDKAESIYKNICEMDNYAQFNNVTVAKLINTTRYNNKSDRLINAIKRFDTATDAFEHRCKEVSELCYEIIMRKSRDRNAIMNDTATNAPSHMAKYLQALTNAGITNKLIGKIAMSMDPQHTKRPESLARTTKTAIARRRNDTELHEMLLDFAAWWIAKHHNIRLLPQKEE